MAVRADQANRPTWRALGGGENRIIGGARRHLPLLVIRRGRREHRCQRAGEKGLGIVGNSSRLFNRLLAHEQPILPQRKQAEEGQNCRRQHDQHRPPEEGGLRCSVQFHGIGFGLETSSSRAVLVGEAGARISGPGGIKPEGGRGCEAFVTITAD
jgi:hypothetical protein